VEAPGVVVFAPHIPALVFCRAMSAIVNPLPLVLASFLLDVPASRPANASPDGLEDVFDPIGFPKLPGVVDTVERDVVCWLVLVCTEVK
jgi:hypothetical protein